MIISFIIHKETAAKTAPRQAIMPDRSLTYSRGGASPVPPNRLGFIDLMESSAIPSQSISEASIK